MLNRSDSRDLSEYVLKSGAISQQLRDAATEGRLNDVVDLVNKYGDDYDVMNAVDARVMSRNFNRTPLLCAIKAGHIDIVKALLKARAIDYKMYQPRYFYTPLAEAAKANQPEIFRILAKLPDISVNAFDWNNNSVLSLTLLHCPSALSALLDVPHLDVNATDKQKRTSLHVVAKQPVSMMSESLLASIKLLLNHKKINLNARAESRTTPLMCAAREGNAPLVDLLLRAGADAALKNKSHQTALSIARSAVHHPVIAMMESHVKSGSRYSASAPTLFPSKISNQTSDVAVHHSNLSYDNSYT